MQNVCFTLGLSICWNLSENLKILEKSCPYKILKIKNTKCLIQRLTLHGHTDKLVNGQVEGGIEGERCIGVHIKGFIGREVVKSELDQGILKMEGGIGGSFMDLL